MTIHPFLNASTRNLLSVPDHRGKLIKPGGKVRLLKPHPQAGREGAYRHVVWWHGRWAMVVALSDGEYGVLDASEWERVQP